MIVRISTALLVVLYVLEFSAVVSAFGMNFWKIKQIFKDQRIQHAVKHLKLQKVLGSSGVTSSSQIDDMYMVQLLDHFDAQNPKTYRQRYWVNDAYWKQLEDGPVFLYIGGEGTLSSLCVQYGEHVDLAMKYGALLLGIEHRFYGQSINDDGLLLDNLKYLNSQQALADIAHFHQVISTQYKLTRKNKWIAFGGSYPGALAAWIRSKYPHLVHASAASSAPVDATVNFIGYNDVVARSLGNKAVGGSTKCVEAVNGKFRLIDEMIAKGQLDELAHKFNSCGPLQNNFDVFIFVSNLAEEFMSAVQYNTDKEMSIASVCKTMNMWNNSDRTHDALTSLVAINKEFLRLAGENCVENSWESFINQLSNVTVDHASPSSMRQWIYQTCAQFGYYQTCEANSSCLFSRAMSLQPNLKICQTVYNITPEEVYNRVEFTNEYYGSVGLEGSRILFVNGLIDPWHALGVLHNLTNSMLAIVVPDTSHCADMHQESHDDRPTLKYAKQRISEQVGIWLAGDDVLPTWQRPSKQTVNDVHHKVPHL